MYREDKDEYVTLEADRLKALIKHGKVTVVNLKLTANNALLPIKKKGVPKANDIWPPAR